jgi:hypothetical protein
MSIINEDDFPKRMPHRGVKMRYPWRELELGQGFVFSANIMPQSARVMASQMGKALARDFYVFMGEDGRLYCKRVDSTVLRSRSQVIPQDADGNYIFPVAEAKPASELPRAIEGTLVGQSRKNVAGQDVQPKFQDPWNDPDPDVPVGAVHPREGIIEPEEDEDI